jgi:predicted nuclease with TOPRIM domain
MGLEQDAPGGRAARELRSQVAGVLSDMDIRMERGRVAGSVGVTVLIVLALGLCGLCAFQWVRETKLRIRVDELQAERQKLNDEKASVEAQGRRFQEEIQRVERERAELFKTTQTNNEALVKVRAEFAKASLEAERFRKTADVYKEGFDKANESIRVQNEGVLKLKADVTKVLAERNQAVEKYNELVKQYDEAVQKLNDLVQKWNAQQEELKKQAEAKK